MNAFRIRYVPPLRRVLRILSSATMASGLFAAAGSAAQTAVTFSAPRPILRIEAGKPDGIAEMMIEARITPGDEKVPNDSLIVTDDAVQGTKPTVSFREAIEVITNDASRRLWRVRAALSDFPTAGTTIPRTLRVAWGSFSTSTPLPYWATNAAVPTMTWKVSGMPAEWSARGEWCIPLRIAVGGQRATGLVLTSTLVEQTTKKPMGERLLLKVGGKPVEGAALEAAINDLPRQVSVCSDAGDPTPGKFQGVLNLSPAEKPEGDPITVTISTTNTTVISIGIAVLALGCALAYLLKVLTPARLIRSQALLPAVLIRERATALRRDLTQVIQGQPAVTVTRAPRALGTLIDGLSERTLEAKNFVPRSFPSPFGVTLDAAGYKNLLDTSSATLARLDLLVREGFVAAAGLGGADLTDVMTKLDAMLAIDPPPSLIALQAQIDAEVARLRPPARGGAPATLAPMTSETLTVQIEQTSRILWVGSLLLTFVIGLFVLILNNPAFGVPIDFLYCFLWGFGVPAVATQLTPATAATALGVTLPKTTP